MFNTEQFKKAVLNKAMRGELTTRLPEDGSADDLLKEIDDEKDRLIEEGKIKKQKSLPDIEDDEIPFEIPSNWKWVRMGNIVNLTIGKTPSRSNSDYWNGDIPWVSISDLNNRDLYDTKEKITQEASDKTFKKNIVPAETMLMSFKLSIGKVAITKIPVYHNEAIVSFSFYKHKNDLQRYLFSTVNFLTQFASSKTAIKGNTLNKTSLNNMLIPLPPLAEQQRIVEKLDELFSKLDN